MKKTIVMFLLLILFSFTVLSSPKENTIKKTIKEKEISLGKNSLKETQECKKTFYDSEEDIYEEITKERNIYGICTSYSYDLVCKGPLNESCEKVKKEFKYKCITGKEKYTSKEKIGTKIVKKTKEECEPKKYTILNKANLKEQKLDFLDFGPCIQEKKNNCIIITCVSKFDGAHNGEFTDCKGGKSCQRYEICEDKITKYHKNSNKEFIEYDPSFFLSESKIKEGKE